MQLSQKTDKVVWYSHLFKSFPRFVMIHTVKGFSVADETETDVSLKFPGFLYNPVNVGNLISGSSSFSKSNLDIWKFSVCIMLKYLTMWIITNCGKLLKIWEYHNLQQLSCLLRNLYAVQEATLLEPCMEQLIGSRLRKEYNRAVCCHPVCLTNTLSTS